MYIDDDRFFLFLLKTRISFVNKNKIKQNNVQINKIISEHKYIINIVIFHFLLAVAWLIVVVVHLVEMMAAMIPLELVLV